MGIVRDRASTIVVCLMLFMITPASAADLQCAECGMTVTLTSKYAATLTQGGKTIYFCDIGDMIIYLLDRHPKGFKAQVKDYPSNEWIDAGAAYYVPAESRFKSPMGWGIAAFKDRNEASKSGTPMDFDGVVKILK